MMYYRYWYHKPSQIKQLKDKIYNIDEDITKILFSFDNRKLNIFFILYNSKYGESAANYAKKAFSSWKEGGRGYSATTIRRFIELVPQIIDNTERHNIIKKLYYKSIKSSNYSYEVVLGDLQALSGIVKTFNSLCEKPFSHNLSEEFKNQMRWLCDNNSVAINRLLSAFDSEHSLLISKVAKQEINNLIDKISRLDSSVVGTHTCNFPFGRVTIVVRQPTMFEKVVRILR